MSIPRTLRSLFPTLVNGGLVAFFLIGSVVNLFPPETVRHDYARWGYPDWFHYITGIIELSTATLLAMPRTRALGRISGALVMLAALSTLLFHAELAHAVGPAVILMALLLSGYLEGWTREARAVSVRPGSRKPLQAIVLASIFTRSDDSI